VACQEAAEEAVGIPTGVKVAAAVVGGGCGYPGGPGSGSTCGDEENPC